MSDTQLTNDQTTKGQYASQKYSHANVNDFWGCLRVMSGIPLLLLCALIPFFFVFTERDHNDCVDYLRQNHVVVPNIDKVKKSLEGKPVLLTGLASTQDVLTDTTLGVKAVAIHMRKEVQYYQWMLVKEPAIFSDCVTLSPSITTSARYACKKWTHQPQEQLDDVSDEEENFDNFVLLDAGPELNLTAKNVTIGAYKLNNTQIEEINKEIGLTNIKLLADVYEQNKAKLKKPNDFFIKGNILYIGSDPENANIGDVKISYFITLPRHTITLLAGQHEDTFIPYVKKGACFRYQELLIHEASQEDFLDKRINYHNQSLLGVLIFTTVLSIIGFTLTGRFLTAVVSNRYCNPIIKLMHRSSVLGYTVGGIVYTLFFTLIGWLFGRPIIFITIISACFIVVVIAILVAVFKRNTDVAFQKADLD